MKQLSETWVYFFAGEKSSDFLNRSEIDGQKDHYEILDVVPVTGQPPVSMKTQGPFLRLETSLPMPLFESVAQWKGTVRHLQYTTAQVRTELQKRSASPYPASDSTLAVMIPIRKSEKWWNLAQDERQKYFEKKSERQNHTAIGYGYADRIYRKLYHSRYLEVNAPLGYDFLTYFEFHEKNRALFKNLLRDLRDLSINPEWQFVDFELEIWMNKTERREEHEKNRVSDQQ